MKAVAHVASCSIRFAALVKRRPHRPHKRCRWSACTALALELLVAWVPPPPFAELAASFALTPLGVSRAPAFAPPDALEDACVEAPLSAAAAADLVAPVAASRGGE